jgi:hypothetical protein
MKRIEGPARIAVIKEHDGNKFDFEYVPYECPKENCPEFLLVKANDMKLGKPRAPATINFFNYQDIEAPVPEPEEDEESEEPEE